MNYCVYLTTYKGNKLPSFYVGSSSVSKIENDYRGSVSSEEFKETWEMELKENPNLFEIKIISLHETRKEALEAELNFQKENDVVKSKDYINKSFAIPNGFFGMDVSGDKNPMYGKSRTGETHKGGENISSALTHFYSNTDKGKYLKEQYAIRFKENNPSCNSEIMEKIKQTWKENKRNAGEKNGMFGKKSPSKGKKLYNNGYECKAFLLDEQPEGWVMGRLNKPWNKK